MKVIAYIIINLLIFSSWYILLFRKKHILSFIDRLIGTFILGLAQIIFTEMLLGVLFKKLFATPLLLFNAAISLGVLALSIILPTPPESSDTPLLKRGAGGNLMAILLEIKDEAIRFFKIIKGDSVLLCIFGLFFILVCWIVFLGYLFPSYTWDALWYHLPIVGYILQSGAIQENATPFAIDLFINIFPKNIEFFFIWNVIFLKNDVIVDLSQLFFTVVGVFTIYSIALKLGLKEKEALYSSFLFFFTPLVILQSTTNYVDIAVAVLFLVAINFLMYDNLEDSSSMEAGIIPQVNSKIYVLLAGLTAGILLGSKGSGPLFVVLLIAVALTREFIKRNISSLKHQTYPLKERFILYLVYFIIPVFLMGGYWYLKNWILYGNPVYPIQISFFNITLFRGLFEGMIDPLPSVLKDISPVKRLFYVWLERVKYYLYDSRLSGFGPVWFILMLPSVAIAFFYAIKSKKYNFLFAGTILIIAFVLYPRNWYTRYVIFIIGLGSLSFGMALDYFKERQKAINIITLLLVIYTFITANSPCVMPWKIGEFMNLPPKERIIARLAPFNIDMQARQEYGYWIWINNNILEDNTLAYTFEPLFLFPMWNRGFSNRVVYVKSESYNDWVKSLQENGATHVLVKQNSVEDKWIKGVKKLSYRLWWTGNTAERFKTVYSDENYKVLRFKD